MIYYAIMAKAYNVEKDGSAILEDATVLSVKTSLEDAQNKVAELKESYTTDKFNVSNTETSDEDFGIVITTAEDSEFRLVIYIEGVPDEDEIIEDEYDEEN